MNTNVYYSSENALLPTGGWEKKIKKRKKKQKLKIQHILKAASSQRQTILIKSCFKLQLCRFLFFSSPLSDDAGRTHHRRVTWAQIFSLCKLRGRIGAKWSYKSCWKWTLSADPVQKLDGDASKGSLIQTDGKISEQWIIISWGLKSERKTIKDFFVPETKETAFFFFFFSKVFPVLASCSFICATVGGFISSVKQL